MDSRHKDLNDNGVESFFRYDILYVEEVASEKDSEG